MFRAMRWFVRDLAVLAGRARQAASLHGQSKHMHDLAVELRGRLRRLLGFLRADRFNKTPVGRNYSQRLTAFMRECRVLSGVEQLFRGAPSAVAAVGLLAQALHLAAGLCGDIARSAEKLDRRQAAERWSQWTEAASDKALHRYSAPREPWQPRSVDAEEGQSAGPAQQLAADLAAWSVHWGLAADDAEEERADQAWLQAWLREPSAPMPPITGAGILAASVSFSHDTSAVYGWHPRHYSLVSPDTRHKLAGLLMEIEREGAFPTAARALIVRLITTKRRPIGL